MTNELDILVLDGDGIGPEITRATLDVLEAASSRYCLPLRFTMEAVGLPAFEREGSTLPERIVAQAQAADGILLAPVDTASYPPREEGGVNPSGTLRRKLDLFANIRPARTRPGVPPPCGKPFDCVIFRENTEGFYADRNMAVGSGEFMPTPDLALSVRKISRDGCLRIARVAFAHAATRPAQHVTAVHKANVLKLGDGLFLASCREVAAQYPQIRYDEVIVDAMAALLIRDPGAFDTIVTTNMFGDILSDQASELSGSLGLAASLNAGDAHAMAQAQHGSAPDIAGRGIANPASLIGSAAMLLDWLGARHAIPALRRAATAIEKAIDDAVVAPGTRTRDMGGEAGTDAFARAVIAGLEQVDPSGAPAPAISACSRPRT
ncbi:MAG: isocitrate/isopropylmalate dehydrogenase family protein [Salinarimonas sp.]|nr:isocitrate/isopropylmalate dehydrogenase family protein [Salinarimonas sp.]